MIRRRDSGPLQSDAYIKAALLTAMHRVPGAVRRQRGAEADRCWEEPSRRQKTQAG